jgi:uncharacterized repeat protein (TIGR03803 family)
LSATFAKKLLQLKVAHNEIPQAGLIRDAQGNLYGTTRWGGETKLKACRNNISNGCGVIFKLDPSGDEIVLHSFRGGKDGGGPLSELVQDAVGNLYGTTGYGGDLSCPPARLRCGVRVQALMPWAT